MKILLATVALSILPIAASAQDKPDGKVLFRCQDVGHPVQEPLGDREGHAIEVAPYSCRVESGAWKDGVMTGTAIWEWDGPKATELSNSGVTRGPGGAVAYNGKRRRTQPDDGRWQSDGFYRVGKRHERIGDRRLGQRDADELSLDGKA
jgi:hypothetical protein